MSVLIGTALNDTLTGAAGDDNTIFGDAVDTIAAGGNDTLTGGANGSNTIFGDVGGGMFQTDGGDDILTGGANSTNVMVGDAGGTIYAGTIESSNCGNDTLVGGTGGSNVLFGDTSGVIFDTSRGGDDTLIGGDDATNTLIGDADTLTSNPADRDSSSSFGGNDLLTSGTGVDEMWGDARHVLERAFGGRDVFRFLANSGEDIIHDFERGKDLIDVSAIVSSFASLSQVASLQAATGVHSVLGGFVIDELDVDGDGKSDSVINFDAENRVTVLGMTGLAAGDFVGIESSSYVLFSRTSPPQGTRNTWLGSEANSHPSTTPGNSVAASAFDADRDLGPGTALAGPGAADYVADGILANGNIAMFNLTETSPGVFATDAPADLSARIATQARFFGTASSDLDPVLSEIDPAAGTLHLAQTDRDWNGIKNLEISLDSGTSFRDIRLENFVDIRLKVGDGLVNPDEPVGGTFDLQLLGAKRGEVDASRAPQAINLVVEVWSNEGTFQNSFDIKGSAFADVVTIRPGDVTGSRFGQSESWYQRSEDPQGIFYVGAFTTVSANLGHGDDQFDSLAEFHTAEGFLITENGQFRSKDHVWGGTGSDAIRGGYGDDRLFGDHGSGAWTNPDPIAESGAAPSGFEPTFDIIDGGAGADWLEGNTSPSGFGLYFVDDDPFGELAFIEFFPEVLDQIDCGLAPPIKGPRTTDGDPDVVNFNAGDGFDLVTNFEPGIDTLRLANTGLQMQQVVPSTAGLGLVIFPDEFLGGIFLLGVTAPLGQTVDGDNVLLS